MKKLKLESGKEIELTDYTKADLNKEGCFNLLSSVVESYFNKEIRFTQINYLIHEREKTMDEKRLKKALRPLDEEDLTFANSKVLYAWADCSNNFEANKLREQIKRAFIEQQELYLSGLRAIKQKYELSI